MVMMDLTPKLFETMATASISITQYHKTQRN